ncbi:hypothetical protein NBEOAGPD_1477 [Methylobacterium gregans]|uniref:Uncharacterized protein n=1 Tax=Methylobacterium gregans TaxID=374424 RepID=A0AA37HMA7_9HYPH|nr:hypothetical protein [Methylobacterium gregans]GJD78263.1 hypothetical protein NBEOAGPD_1477 [Methylobacterium gregans]
MIDIRVALQAKRVLSLADRIGARDPQFCA